MTNDLDLRRPTAATNIAWAAIALVGVMAAAASAAAS